MKIGVRSGLLALLAGASLSAGCSRPASVGHYVVSRYYDARDTIAAGVGLTYANPVTGNMPPSLGAYVEVTDYLHFGAITHNGYTAEMDLRGTFVGPEQRRRRGFITWQSLQIKQDYETAFYRNAFKDAGFPWSQRMSGHGYRFNGHPAKRLAYDYWSINRQQGRNLRPRGWQYWEYVGAEVALSDPFLTHFGFMLRFGFDISELSDFVLGILCIDYKEDDLTPDEYHLRRGKTMVFEEAPPPSAADEPPPQF